MPDTSPFPPFSAPPFAPHPQSSSPDDDALLLSVFEDWLNESLKKLENAKKDNTERTESRLDFRNAIFHYISNLKQVILDLNAYIADHLDTDSPQSKIPESIQQAQSVNNKRRKVTQEFLRAARQEQARTRRELKSSEGNLDRVTEERDEARFELRRLSEIIARLEEDNKLQREKNPTSAA